MQITPTIRTEIQDYLHKLSLNMSQFASIAGLNAGTISGMLMSNRTMSVHQLDCVTRAMEKPEDYFYSRYIQESLLEASVDWRRAKAFLQRCMELNRLDCIAQVANVLMENVTYYAGLVFELAEEFFAQEHYAAAKILYENVAFSEKHQHSERLAVCQYRLFKIRIGDDPAINFRTAILFEVFVERLNEIEQLDALKDLANVYRSLREWDKVEEVANKMKEKAKIQYSIKHQQANRRQDEPTILLSRPLFLYVAYADLLCSGSCEVKGDYEGALQHTYAYSNLEWVLEKDEDSQHWLRLFRNWAEGNTYVYKLLSGDLSVYNNYVEYIARSIDEADQGMITRLLNLMLAVNKYHLDADGILNRCKKFLDSFVQQPSEDLYSKQVIPEQHARLSYELAYYFLHRAVYDEGFKHLMVSMKSYHIMRNETCYLNSIGMFEHFRSYVGREVQEEYSKFVGKVWLDRVEKNGAVNLGE